MDYLRVLDLEKVLASVAIHIDEDFRPLIPLKLPGCRVQPVVPAPHEVEDGLVSQVFCLVVDLDIGAVEVMAVGSLIEESCWEVVAGIACMVIGEHEDYVVVGDAHTLEVVIHDERVASVSVVVGNLLININF